jgi:hypothetical protein
VTSPFLRSFFVSQTTAKAIRLIGF